MRTTTLINMKQQDHMGRITNMLLKLGETPDSLMFWAFRYFLGRMSIAAAWFAQGLAEAWPHLTNENQERIKMELEQAFRKDDEFIEAGPEIRQRWNPFGDAEMRADWERVRRAWRGYDLQRRTPKVREGK